jgi:hypothetical protein
VDLAEDGMSVNFGKKLPPTCKVYFQFQLPGQMASVRLSGQVVWQDWNGRAGIQFVHVPQSSRRVLQEWLKMNLADMAKPGATKQKADSIASVEVEHSTQPNADEVAANAQAQARERNEIEHDEESSLREAAPRASSDPDNRRQQTRYTCRLGAEVYQQGSSVRNYCHLSDLSPGGCYLEMPLAFAQGTPVEIVVRTYEMKLRVSGQVKASHPGYGMGISFMLTNKHERDGVQQLIDFVAATTQSSE